VAVARQILAERTHDGSVAGNLFVHLDPRRPGVVVPAHLAAQPHLVREVGYDMPRPIPDLDVGRAGIAATLSFHQEPFTCFVPWSAVFALTDDGGRGQVWQKDVPPEVARDGGVGEE
jgi:hypothetical protein